MTGQHLIVVAGVVALAGCGGSELRRALNDVIDQREAGATEAAAVYEAFGAELTEELMAEWGATPDGGCPELETLPTGFSWDRSERQEMQQARREAWVRNIPAYQCRCLQNTIAEDNRVLNVRRAVADLALDSRFDQERAELAELTEEELPMVAPMLRASANQFSAEPAHVRVELWKSRRYGGDGESGWQAAAEQDERTRPFASCDTF
ncbi:MAG: hypothetical protein OXG35_34345 [Acidobacteria bacterium]|nr:hypothetical protein [Acidobacteriota bacterium]